MPSVAVTPASYALTWGDVKTIPARERVTKLTLALGMGTVNAAPGIGTSLSVTTPTLNTQKRQLPIGYVEMSGKRLPVYVETQEQLRQQRQKEAIEAAFTALTSQVGSNTTLIAAIQAAMAKATAANDNALEVKATTSLANSYTDPVSVLTASNDGTVTIAAHSRVYGDDTRVPVNAGSVTGQTNGSYVTIYYMDAGREGGAVLYQATTSPIAQKDAVHIVGQVTIPAAGEPAAAGGGTSAPGYTPPPGGGLGGGYVEP